MKTGLKLWSTNDFYIEEAKDLFKDGRFSYIELFTVPESLGYIKYWKKLDIPFILHAPHSLAGFNPAAEFSRKENLELIFLVDEYRKELEPEYIIFHPGLNGTAEESVFQFNSIFEKFPEIQQIALLENKPFEGINGEKCIGATPDEMKKLLDAADVGFCLDLGHCICAANSLEIPPFTLIREFLDLKPCMFHLSDGDFKSGMDAHLNYGNGNFPIEKILELLPENPMITIETEKNSLSSLNSFVQDVVYLKNIKL
jgi:sugar phosphate isomerase/epimerase